MARNCTDLYVWSDYDREGEAIAFEIAEVCTNANPEIKIHRAKFSSLTDEAIQEAFANPVSLNQNLSDAVSVRQEYDLRTGSAFT